MLSARGIGGLVTEVRVRDRRLDDGAPVALRDTAHTCDLMIDFSQPPDVLAAALEELFREAVDSGRWTRQRSANTDEAGPDTEAGPTT